MMRSTLDQVTRVLLCAYAVILLAVGVTTAGELRYGNLQVVFDDEVIIAPASIPVHASNMLVDRQGTIWINTSTTQPGLFRSADYGKTWTATPIRLQSVPDDQYVAGFTATRDGRLWIVHQEPPTGGGLVFSPDVFVSVSSDQGMTWNTERIDYSGYAPTAPRDPYVKMAVAWCHPNFIERRDGSLMFSASMTYADATNYLQDDQSRPGVRDVMIRTTDGGRTWGDPTIVHQHATETAYAIDPNNPEHILAATRTQRKALPGEDEIEILKKTGVPYPPGSYIYKNGLLLESTDGGRSFKETPGGLLAFGSYRFSVVWTPKNMIVIASVGGQRAGETQFDDDHVVRVSLDGGRTWADGSTTGTVNASDAKTFSVVPTYRDIGKRDHYSAGVPATVQLPSGRFLTLCRYKRDKILKGKVWHLENAP